MHEALIAAVLVAAGIWLWRESLRAREAATRAGRRACRENDVQFLDETVALAKMNLAWISHRIPAAHDERPGSSGTAARRRPDGRLVLVRSYRFDYSVDGSDRAAGLVVVQGGTVVHIQLTVPETLH